MSIKGYVPNRDGLLSDFFQELLASVFDASSFEISQLRQLGYVSSSLKLPLVQLDNYITSDNMLEGAKWRPYLAAQSDRVVSLPSVRPIDSFKI